MGSDRTAVLAPGHVLLGYVSLAAVVLTAGTVGTLLELGLAALLAGAVYRQAAPPVRTATTLLAARTRWLLSKRGVYTAGDLLAWADERTRSDLAAATARLRRAARRAGASAGVRLAAAAPDGAVARLRAVRRRFRSARARAAAVRGAAVGQLAVARSALAGGRRTLPGRDELPAPVARRLPEPDAALAGSLLAAGAGLAVGGLFVRYTLVGLLLGGGVVLAAMDPGVSRVSFLEPYVAASGGQVATGEGSGGLAGGERAATGGSPRRSDDPFGFVEAMQPMAVREFAVDLASEHPSTPSLATNVQQVAALYQYVSDEVEYVSDPRDEYVAPAPETLRTGGGDCDCQAVLAASLFEAIGARSRVVWIDSGLGRSSHLVAEVALGRDPAAIGRELRSFYADHRRNPDEFAYSVDDDGWAWYVADPTLRYLGDIQGLYYGGFISDEDPWGWYDVVGYYYPDG